jgi:hypothetical protein
MNSYDEPLLVLEFFQKASLVRCRLCHFRDGYGEKHIGALTFIVEIFTKFLNVPCWFQLVPLLNRSFVHTLNR